MKKIKNNYIFKTIIDFLKIILTYNQNYLYILFFYIIVNSIIPFVNIFFSQFIIDELIGKRNPKNLLLLVSLSILLGGGLKWISKIIRIIKEKYDDEFTNLLKIKIAEKSMQMKYEYTEDATVLELLERAKKGLDLCNGGIGGIADSITNLFINLLSLFGVLTIIIIGVPELLLIFIATLFLDIIFTNRNNDIQLKAFSDMAKHNRAFQYYYYKLCDYRYGQDIRLFQAEKLLDKKTDYYNSQMVLTLKKQSSSTLPYQLASSILSVIRLGSTILVLGYKVLDNNITLGEFSKYYNSNNSMQDCVKGLIGCVQELIMNCKYASECIQYLNYKNENLQGTESIEKKEKHCIVFKDVSFIYPKDNKPTLKNINVTIYAGEHVSIVGLNGAGKTTFIKLICRLYEPTTGTIYIDDVDIRKYKYNEYMQLISVVFQDFQLFSFSAYENIILDSLKGNGESKKRELTDIFDKVGMSELFEELPSGFDTHIFRDFVEEGINLSGGQLQKMAIARALYKNAPIVILDEPTAALDPISEFDIYSKFGELAKNKTTLFISHRLSVCQICDRILVFNEGSIVEIGTHENLIKNGGLYYQMYNAQAQYYQN